MKTAVIVAALAGVLVGGGAGAGITAAVVGSPTAGSTAGSGTTPTGGSSSAPSAGSSGGELPPECVKVAISENSGNGPVLWTQWCGTGSAGEPPMRAGTGQLVVDGATLDPASCTQANPCVIVWPNSPKS